MYRYMARFEFTVWTPANDEKSAEAAADLVATPVLSQIEAELERAQAALGRSINIEHHDCFVYEDERCDSIDGYWSVQYNISACAGSEYDSWNEAGSPFSGSYNEKLWDIDEWAVLKNLVKAHQDSDKGTYLSAEFSNIQVSEDWKRGGPWFYNNTNWL